MLTTIYLFPGARVRNQPQALKCGTNHCPTGIATQDPALMKGLVVPNKTTRVQRFQNKTVHAATEIISAAGVSDAAGKGWLVLL